MATCAASITVATLEWRRSRHWVAPEPHTLLQFAAPQGQQVVLQALISSVKLAYLRDHRFVIIRCACFCHSCVSSKVYKLCIRRMHQHFGTALNETLQLHSSSTQTQPGLLCRVLGSSIMPGTGLFEMLLAGANVCLIHASAAHPTAVNGVSLPAALELPVAGAALAHLSVDLHHGSMQLSSMASDGLLLHAFASSRKLQAPAGQQPAGKITLLLLRNKSSGRRAAPCTGSVASIPGGLHAEGVCSPVAPADNCLQLAAASSTGKNTASSALRIPASLEALRAAQQPGLPSFFLGAAKSCSQWQASAAAVYDFSMAGVAGHSAGLRLARLSLKAVRPSQRHSAAALQETAVDTVAASDCLYEVSWPVTSQKAAGRHSQSEMTFQLSSGGASWRATATAMEVMQQINNPEGSMLQLVTAGCLPVGASTAMVQQGSQLWGALRSAAQESPLLALAGLDVDLATCTARIPRLQLGRVEDSQGTVTHIRTAECL